MTTERQPFSPDRKVLLYSGGVDSYCTAVVEQPDVLLHVSMGGRYGDAEAQRIRTPLGMGPRLVRIRLPLADLFERQEDKVVPARNAILGLVASNYGNDILLGSVAGSRGSDKDPEFADRMNALMAKMYEPQDVWLPNGRKVTLRLPVYHLTKRQLVGRALDAGEPAWAVRNRTFSCYTPHSTWRGARECGRCAPCGRKWAALVANGIEPRIDAMEAFRPYWDEVVTGTALDVGRTPQFVKDVIDAWEAGTELRRQKEARREGAVL
jgi:7-cyano-7-deazaguanine synthase in queuosine biosynthesis